MERKIVLLLRAAKSPEDQYDVVLRQACYTPHFLPVLHFRFVNQQALSTALLNSSQYSGLIFTSQTAVESAAAALSAGPFGTPDDVPAPQNWRERVTEEWRSHPIFVVGKGTAQAANCKLGLKPFGSYSGNAEELSRVITEYFSSQDNSHDHRPLLFPCSNLKRETLPRVLREAGLGLDSLNCYNTEPHPDILSNLHSLLEMLSISDGSSLYTVFFSPSGVNYALDKILTIFEDKVSIKLVAIGPTSAEALSKAGYPPSATANKPTPESLAKAISNIS